ncbi:MAG: thymidylate kinase [Terracidiphilus sp.]
MFKARTQRRTVTVSFSGIDGAGKSTQIAGLRSRLIEAGFHVEVMTFWEHVALFTRARESAGHTLFKGDKGVGTPLKPILRRDKNVRSLPMAAIRLVLYALDAVSAWIVLKRAQHAQADVLILDRWTYDELANLNLDRWMNRAYVQVISRLVPRPDISFVLDAEPNEARARKPEYPIEFLVANRASYLRLSTLIPLLTVLLPGSLDETERTVADRVMSAMVTESGDVRVTAMDLHA